MRFTPNRPSAISARTKYWLRLSAFGCVTYPIDAKYSSRGRRSKACSTRISRAGSATVGSNSIWSVGLMKLPRKRESVSDLSSEKRHLIAEPSACSRVTGWHTTGAGGSAGRLTTAGCIATSSHHAFGRQPEEAKSFRQLKSGKTSGLEKRLGIIGCLLEVDRYSARIIGIEI